MAKSSRDGSSITGSQHGGQSSRQDAAAHYREYAAQLRDLADGEPDSVLRDRLIAIANEYDALAERLDPRP